MSSQFGQIVTPTQVEYAVRDVLRKWFPTYLREVERQSNWTGEPLPAPRNYIIRNSFDAQPGEEMPKVAIISPGLLNIPTQKADGYYQATFQVGVGVAIAGRTEDEAESQSKMYGAAIRAMLLQHQDLEATNIEVTQVIWLDENFDDLELEDQFMNYKAAGVYAGVTVENVTSRWFRPSEIDELPQTIDEVDKVITEIEGYATSEVPHP